MNKEKKLSLLPLIALVIGSMIGGGLFALPQNLAVNASLSGVLIAWLITAIGMIALAFTLVAINEAKPELENGIYSYVREGFGPYMAFNSAWGYWLSAWIGNVSYAVLFVEALSYFIPILGDGHNAYALLLTSSMLWIFHLLILRGMQQAAQVNTMVTFCKLIPILLFILLGMAFFKSGQIEANLTIAKLGPIKSQVSHTLLITLWIFIGVEGAVVVSSHAKNRKVIAVATLLGLILTWFIYVIISVLSYSLLPQAKLATLANPSLAYLLQSLIGPWGAIIVNAGLILSVLGAWLGWTLLCIQLPFDAALDGAMPSCFKKQNHCKMPVNILWLSSGLIQLLLIFTYFSKSTYLFLIQLGSSCILLPYGLCALYGVRLFIFDAKKKYTKAGFSSVIAVLYCLLMLYAADHYYLLLSLFLFAFGLIFYLFSPVMTHRKPSK